MSLARRTHAVRARGAGRKWLGLALGLAGEACVRVPRGEAVDAGAAGARAARGRAADAGQGRGEAVPAHWRIAAEAGAEVEAAAAFGDTLVVLTFDRSAVEFPSRRWSQFVREETTGALGIYRQRLGAEPGARAFERVTLHNPSPGWALASAEHGALAVGYQGRDPEQEFSFRFVAREPALDRVWTYRFPPEAGASVRPGLVPMVVRAGASGDAWVVCARVWRGAEASVRCAALGAGPGSLGPWRVIDSLAGYDPVGMARTPEGAFVVGLREEGDAGLWAYRAQRVGVGGAAEGAPREMGAMRFTRTVLPTAFGPAAVGTLSDGRAGGLLGALPPDTLEGAFLPGMTGYAVDDGLVVVDGERGAARWLRGGVLGEFRPWPAWVWTEVSRASPRALASSDGVVVLIESPHDGARTLLAFRPAE